MRKSLGLISLGLVVIALCGFGAPPSSDTHQVARVIDGDTIELASGEKVRYIGINAPETKHPNKAVEYFGKEAYEANKLLVEGKKVRLEFDIQKRDKYGRLLAYVYQGNVFVNEWLVKMGYAEASSYPPNIKHHLLFEVRQNDARGNYWGLWSPIYPKGKNIKKYVGSMKSDKFHKPSCFHVKKIKAYNKIWFSSKEEAANKRYYPCLDCKP